MVVGGKQCASRSTIIPTKTCSADLYRRIKRRVGCSLKRTHCTGNLVPSRKQATHKLPGPRRLQEHHRAASPSRGLPNNMQQVAPASDRLFCNKVEQQAGSICVTSTGPPGLGSRCTQPVMEGSGPICLPTSSHLGQSGGQVAGLPMQENHPDYSRMAQHALGLGCSDYVQPDPTIQSDSIRNLSNLNLHAWLLKPQQSWTRASLRQWQHELRLIKEDQPDQSMRQSGPFFHRDRPMGWRGIPCWNLYLVLHELTKAPFKEASLKHLRT